MKNFSTVPAPLPGKLQRVRRGAPCPICNHTDWCSTAENGDFAICMRVSDGSLRLARNGGFIHLLAPATPRPRVFTPPEQVAPSVAPIARRHTVYTALLAASNLSGRHSDDLLRRGLHDTFIAHNLFASVPGESRAKTICSGLASRFDLSGVPGFFRDADRWRLNVGGWCAGFFVPVRDLAGRIQALQIRRDSGEPRYIWLSSKDKSEGATSGAPIHFAAAHRLREGSAIITEGALKSDVIAQYTESAVIGLAGVNGYNSNFGTALKAAGVRNVQIAFDADWQSNPAVSRGLERLGLLLRDAGLKVSRLDWALSEGKGLDDLLVQEVA